MRGATSAQGGTVGKEESTSNGPSQHAQLAVDGVRTRCCSRGVRDVICLLLSGRFQDVGEGVFVQRDWSVWCGMRSEATTYTTPTA